MKLLKLAAAVITAASVLATSAAATPNQFPDNYYIFTPKQGEATLAFIPNSFERNGNHVQAWLGLSVPLEHSIVYVLADFDCAGGTINEIGAAFYDTNAPEKKPQVGPIHKVETIAKGSRFDLAKTLVYTTDDVRAKLTTTFPKDKLVEVLEQHRKYVLDHTT